MGKDGGISEKLEVHCPETGHGTLRVVGTRVLIHTHSLIGGIRVRELVQSKRLHLKTYNSFFYPTKLFNKIDYIRKF